MICYCYEMALTKSYFPKLFNVVLRMCIFSFFFFFFYQRETILMILFFSLEEETLPERVIS